MEDDLTWLARNVTDSHMCDWYIKVADGYSSMTGGTPTGMSGTWCSRKQIIQRRAELQNKPSWSDAPEWATHLAQNGRGQWWFMLNGKLPGDGGGYFESDRSTIEVARGEVLGDWRDTLERRPADLSSAAVIKRLDEATQNVLAAVPALMDEKYSLEPELMPVSVSNETVQLDRPIAVAGTGNGSAAESAFLIGRVIDLLRTSVDHFSANELAELHQLCDAELTKRDAAVCGGQKYLDAQWFERGELPPVGTVCLYVVSDRLSAEVEITAHAKLGLCFVQVGQSGESYVSKTAELHRFRPIRTEREVAIEEMCNVAGLDGLVFGLVAGELYDAGYRKQNLPAK
ncbi:hypothetical protein KAM448_05210 [Aeromonas caviae]|uniref:Uncharacterized protein n=1 Tax=Aeromonas caviae TaxID=648 RepID=A0ABD0B8Q2_AERCA|nr:hypothetical protein [Aeromonas caviae]BCR29948.1 hypothetical protein KAM376_29540 [Aeromonas caviae]GJA81056.1 hypothetical protein KAM355_16160 [Aeromonas caviae]GJA98503.1 hypothetical protein KAM359_19110 [Aeromonas caviae]GJB10735.1 hypothetical protein KAM362_12950 [Aeromonas caviae]GJB23351.1 hypothetical protein KAM365_11010 [Aeromonas caviae]